MTAQERFLAKVSQDESGCWLWQAHVHPNGYGSFHGGGHSLAHRFAYATYNGPIPEGMDIDHLCRVRHCVNPEHLEAVTRRENCRRGIKGVLTTHCPQGHEYTSDNTATNRDGSRYCRECNRIKVRRYHAAGYYKNKKRTKKAVA